MEETHDSGHTTSPVEKPLRRRGRIWLISYIKRKAHERKTKKEKESSADRATRHTAIATIWMAVFTVVLAFVSGGTLWILNKQLGEMRSGGTDTHNLAVAAGKQADATNNLAAASQDSAQIARQQLEASSRPWVIAAISNTGPLTFTPSGAQLVFDVILSNVGHSPALDLDVRCDVVASIHHLYVMDREKRLIESYRLRPQVLVATLFPEQPPQRQQLAGPAVTEAGETDAFSAPYISFSIVGCVGYRFESGLDPHHTCFAYNVAQITADGEGQLAFPVSSRKDVPANRLRLYQNVTSGVPAN